MSGLGGGEREIEKREGTGEDISLYYLCSWPDWMASAGTLPLLMSASHVICLSRHVVGSILSRSEDVWDNHTRWKLLTNVTSIRSPIGSSCHVTDIACLFSLHSRRHLVWTRRVLMANDSTRFLLFLHVRVSIYKYTSMTSEWKYLLQLHPRISQGTDDRHKHQRKKL